MLSRIIALAIFLITTAAIHAEYYLIRVDLTKPLDKAASSGSRCGGSHASGWGICASAYAGWPWC